MKKTPRSIPAQPIDPETNPAVSTVAAITKDAAPKDVQALLDQISDLQSKLRVAETARSDAEKAALAAAEAQGMLMQRDRPDVPTGKTVKVQRLDHMETVGYREDSRPINKPRWKTVELPTYFYRVDLPPVGGVALVMNGAEFYHGVVYEFDEDTLRSVKEMVFRLWDHDRNIHGSDENAYRQQMSPSLSARRA